MTKLFYRESKDFAIVGNGEVDKNLNKSSGIHKLEKKLKREQRALARKLENKKKRGEKSATEGGRTRAKNVLRVQKLHQRLANMRNAYRAYIVSMLVKTKPAYITIEDLNVKGMMKNRHWSHAMANQGFYDFTLNLFNACKKVGIELRQVSRFYPSSKLCANCGHKKTKLSLSERVYHCEVCRIERDRDLNAAMNLQQAKEYIVLT